jgi:hypothetical protein
VVVPVIGNGGDEFIWDIERGLDPAEADQVESSLGKRKSVDGDNYSDDGDNAEVDELRIHSQDDDADADELDADKSTSISQSSVRATPALTGALRSTTTSKPHLKSTKPQEISGRPTKKSKLAYDSANIAEAIKAAEEQAQKEDADFNKTQRHVADRQAEITAKRAETRMKEIEYKLQKKQMEAIEREKDRAHEIEIAQIKAGLLPLSNSHANFSNVSSPQANLLMPSSDSNDSGFGNFAYDFTSTDSSSSSTYRFPNTQFNEM